LNNTQFLKLNLIQVGIIWLLQAWPWHFIPACGGSTGTQKVPIDFLARLLQRSSFYLLIKGTCISVYLADAKTNAHNKYNCKTGKFLLHILFMYQMKQRINVLSNHKLLTSSLLEGYQS